jgi:hypothetical protein
MAGLGSSHIFYDSTTSKVTAKAIQREDNCRRQFDFAKYEFVRSTNPITQIPDETLLVYPPKQRETIAEDKRNMDKLALVNSQQRQQKGT